MKTMLDIAGLHRPGLMPVSFALPSGACIAVRGPSGAGKTLLLRAIADLDPCEGNVSLDGVNRVSIPAPSWRRQVSYVPAVSGWWADTVGDHFQNWSAAAPLLAHFKIPEDAAAWPVARCSTGELARLALARALATQPKVLLLDEPTGALDDETTAAVEAVLLDRIAQGAAALWVTHDTAQAARVASRFLLVEGGAVHEAAQL